MSRVRNWVGKQYHKIRKRRCPHHIADPGDVPLEFTEVELPYTAAGDISKNQDILEHLPLVKMNYASDRFIGLFGRVVTTENMTCYQYLWVWDSQIFPIHAMDYAPAIVYVNLGEGTSNFVYYDWLHYKPKNFSFNTGETVEFKLNTLWNSFRRPRISRNVTPNENPMIGALTDSHLRRWWGDDGVINDWYGRKGDKTPILKIRKNFLNPMRGLLPSFKAFDLESRRKIPILEELAMEVRYPFVISAMSTDNLENCIIKMRDIIKPVGDESARRVYLQMAGYIANLTLLHVHGVIELEDPLKEWMFFFDSIDYVEPRTIRAFLRNIPINYYAALNVKFRVNEDDPYFKEVRNAIEWDERYGVLRDEIKDWYKRSISREYAEYRNNIRKHIMDAGIKID